MQNDIKKSVEVLKAGGVILYPTDTTWSLGCDATNTHAVEKVLRIMKQTDPNKLVVLMENPALLERYVNEVPEIAWELVEISTTPLTVIYPNAKNLAPNLLTGDGSIAIRFTKEDFTMQLLQRFRRPIVSAPANTGSDKSSEFFDGISEEIKSQMDYIVEYRQEDTTSARPPGIIKLWPGGRIDIIRK
jgi:L-threonylcarbamoyladenylate synthase